MVCDLFPLILIIIAWAIIVKWKEANKVDRAYEAARKLEELKTDLFVKARDEKQREWDAANPHRYEWFTAVPQQRGAGPRGAR